MACSDLLTSIHRRIPTEVVMFDINLDRSDAGHSRPLSISHYLYRNLLRRLGYSDVLEVAELEFSLEEQGELERFVEHFESRLRDEWERERDRYRDALQDENWRWAFRRDKADALAMASSRLHELLPAHYPTSDHFLKSRQTVEVTPKFLVDRSFEMMARRRKGKPIRNFRNLGDVFVLVDRWAGDDFLGAPGSAHNLGDRAHAMIKPSTSGERWSWHRTACLC